MKTQASENLFDVLSERKLVAQCTDQAIRDRLSSPVVAYVGFDPTADSLHVGSLVPLIALAHAQRCGHKPIVVMGGGTALVGDPSFKSDARRMLTREQIEANVNAIELQIAQLLRLDDSDTGALVLNNGDWLVEKNWVEVLRVFGAHFSVNRMLTMDSVRGRLDSDSGLSFLEFNYMVMQAMDFLHLHQEHGCTVQMGGQDQWGNIVMGIELVRRVEGVHLAGLTFPLLTQADGTKFGKTERGNVWLDPVRTRPFDFYQFWRNTADQDVGRFLRYFTFLSIDQVKQFESREDQAINETKEVLAFELTRWVHGQAEAVEARDSARRAFDPSGDVKGKSIPSAPIDSSKLEEGVGLLALIVQAGLAQSNSEARRHVEGGGVRIHDQKVTDPFQRVMQQHVKDGFVLIRVGKKKMFRFDAS